MLSSTLRIACVLSFVWAVVACGSNGVDPASAAAAEVERLRALGYVDFSTDPADPEQSGVLLHDEDRSHPGYNLYTVRPLGRTELSDLDGKVLNAWFESDAQFWSRSLLLPEGDLLVVGARLPERYVLRLSWNNEILWRHPLPVHHDVRPAPDGSYVGLTMENREIDEIDAATPVRDNSVTFFEPGKAGRTSHSLYDLLRDSPDLVSIKPVKATEGLIDLIHANSVRFMRQKHLVERHPLYAAGNLLVCLRNQDTVVVLDRTRGKILWAWGQDELEGPHDATVLENGNVLIFDNGVRRQWSRVVEVDPRSGRIVWEYRAPEATAFFTRSRGGAQRLPNGNTLITESNRGHAFEVTAGGEIVWDFFVPLLDEKGHRATLVRLYRYESAFVEPLLAR